MIQKFNPADYIKVYIFLNSGYKWGKGWTVSHEDIAEFNAECLAIIEALGLTLCKKIISSASDSGANEHGEYMYFHPMEFTGTFRKSEVARVVNYVKGLSSKHFTVRDVTMYEIDTNRKQNESGYHDNPNVIYERYFMKDAE